MKNKDLNAHNVNPITGWVETRRRDIYEEKAKRNKAIKDKIRNDGEKETKDY